MGRQVAHKLRHLRLRMLLAVSSLLVMSSCYVTKQAYRQAGLLLDREPVNAVLSKGQLSKEDQRKLTFTKSILDYAQRQGLNVAGSYNQFVPVAGQSLTYTVQAAKPFEMELKTWWFPIVGSVPYLGFFDQEDRDQEAKDLENDGYEVHRGAATAFSSLGWFSDPIYQSMLKRADTELAHLLFHELTHRTLWLKDGVEFNENLAEYVGSRLTSEFFVSLGRQDELREFDEIMADYAAVRPWLRQLRDELVKTFKETEGQPTADRLRAKELVLSLAMSKKPVFKRIDFVGSKPWNNARILGASLYAPDTTKFAQAARCQAARGIPGTVGFFLKALEKQAETSGSGFKALDKMCG
jgi:predicted aminopeptidase